MSLSVKKQAGFSLIELLISITIAMFLLLILSDFFIDVFNNKKISEAKADNEREIAFILGKIQDSIKWSGYIAAESLGDMSKGESLLIGAAFDDISYVFPATNLNNCQFSAGSVVSVTDGKTLCLRNYLPPASNSSVYSDSKGGKPSWTSKADLQGILSCSGDFYFSSILNSYENGVMLVTKISTNNGQLVCQSFIEHNGTASDIKTYTSNSLSNIDLMYFTITQNTINVSLTISSVNNVLQKNCTYPDPIDASKTLTTDNKKLCTTVVKTFGFIK